jgi:hypothetical protein
MMASLTVPFKRVLLALQRAFEGGRDPFRVASRDLDD